MVVHQGEIYWVAFAGEGSEPRGRRPAVVVQHDRFNHSRLNTVVVAALTSQLRYAALPGNVRLRKGEANLPKPCVVNVTQLQTIDAAHPLDSASCLRARCFGLTPGLRRLWLHRGEEKTPERHAREKRRKESCQHTNPKSAICC